jgi:hypothetical protein
MFMPLSIEAMFIVTIALFMLAGIMIVALLHNDAMQQKAARIASQESARRPTLNQVTATEMRLNRAPRIHTPKEY